MPHNISLSETQQLAKDFALTVHAARLYGFRFRGSKNRIDLTRGTRILTFVAPTGDETLGDVKAFLTGFGMGRRDAA